MLQSGRFGVPKAPMFGYREPCYLSIFHFLYISYILLYSMPLEHKITTLPSDLNPCCGCARCGSCKMSMPGLQKLQQQLRLLGFSRRAVPKVFDAQLFGLLGGYRDIYIHIYTYRYIDVGIYGEGYLRFTDPGTPIRGF